MTSLSPNIETPPCDPIWPGFSPNTLPIDDPLGTRAALEVITPATAPVSDVVALRHLLGATGDSMEPAVAVRVALKAALEASQAGAGSLWLYQHDGSVARVAHAGLSEGYLQDFAAKADWAGNQRSIVSQPDVVRLVDGQPERDGEVAMAHPPGIRSIAVVPLRSRGMRAGALLLGHSSPVWAGSKSRDLLRAVGEIVAATLDRSRVVADLLASKELHEGLLNAAHDAIVLVDREGRITEVNAAFERLLERPREGVIGQSFMEFLAPEGRERHTADLERLFREGDPMVHIERHLLHRDGSIVPAVLNAACFKDARGVVRGAVGVLYDDREYRAAESSARESHEALEQMLRHLGVGVAMLESPGLRILRCNSALRQILGAPEDPETRPVALGDLLPAATAEELTALARLVIARNEPASLQDLEVRWPEREVARLSLTLAPMPAAAGAPSTHLVLALNDVTERRQFEERYRHSQKLEAVGTLAGGIAHEFNNLLTAILGNVSLALLDLPADHPVVPGLRDSEAAAQRAADLTHQLLGFGRRSPLRPHELDVRELIGEALMLLQRAIDPRIVIVRDDAPDLWQVEADPGQLGEAVMNLFVNARDAMPEGGRLSIRTRNVAGTTARDRTGDFVQIEVADTGTGISPEILPRIYEPFFTTKGPDRGTGLGLAAVHGIIEQHRGWIECESEPQRGTMFRLHLPRAGVVTPSAMAIARGETVLVVDDEEAVLGLARFVLERLGYRVMVARDGVDALEVFRAHRDRIELVVLDQTMPRMSGQEVLRELRALSPDLRIVLTSGYEPGSGPNAEFDALADGFLPKPYPPGLLSRVVREVLDSRR